MARRLVPLVDPVDSLNGARAAHCGVQPRASANQWRTRRCGQRAQWYRRDSLAKCRAQF
jgi:hypothetical protein